MKIYLLTQSDNNPSILRLMQEEAAAARTPAR